MESIIRDNLVSHVSLNGLLDCNQHGFLKKHSTSSQLLECFYDWCRASDEGSHVDLIYLDFSKAFDSVSHSKLLSKLASYNFCFHTVNWIKSFLSDRTQAVKCGASFSSIKPVTSGVPEGSVLGPILFVLFVNDLASICKPCSVKLYADDVKVYYKILTVRDQIELQQCLDRIVLWANQWQLSLSFAKCAFLQLGYSNPNVSYFLGPNKINIVDSYCDLGITVDSLLKPSLHITKIVKKANARAKLILKCFLSRSPSNFIRAFKTYVRPLLEYATTIWNPSLLQDINLIERVQRNFTRNVCIICNLPVLSYDNCLEVLGLERLELRRLYFDLIELFKIVNHFTYSCIFNVLSFNQHALHNTRGHRFKLNVIRSNKNVFKTFFTNRVVNVWNFLPAECFNTNLISTFKNRLLKINFSDFLHGQL